MAKASGDRGFGGYVIALLANQALYRGSNRQVIQYAETALRGARGSLSPGAGHRPERAAGQGVRADRRPGRLPRLHVPRRGHVRAASARTRSPRRPATCRPAWSRRSTPTPPPLGDLTAAAPTPSSPSTPPRSRMPGAVSTGSRPSRRSWPARATPRPRPRRRRLMLDQAAGMESRRIQERIIRVRDAVTGVSGRPRGGRARGAGRGHDRRPAAAPLAAWDTGGHALDGPLREAPVQGRVARHPRRRRRAARRQAPRAPADPHAARRGLRRRPGRAGLLLWRHRFITGSQGWEIPIGKIEPGEDPATAAARETEEETGWRPGPLQFPAPRGAEPRPVRLGALHLPRRRGRADRLAGGRLRVRQRVMGSARDVPSLIGRGDITSGTTLAALLYVIASGL